MRFGHTLPAAVAATAPNAAARGSDALVWSGDSSAAIGDPGAVGGLATDGAFPPVPAVGGTEPDLCLPPRATHHRTRWNPASLLLRRLRSDEPPARVPVSGEVLPDLAPVIAERAAPRRFDVRSESGEPPLAPLARKKSQLLLREARPAAWLAQFPTTSMIFESAMSSPIPPPLPVPSGLGRQRCRPTEAHLPVRCLQPTSLLLRCRAYPLFQGRCLSAGGRLAERPAAGPLPLAPTDLGCRGSAAEDAADDGRREP